MEPNAYSLEKSSSQATSIKSTIANGSTNHSHSVQPPTLILPPPPPSPPKSSYSNGISYASMAKNVNFVPQTTRSFRNKLKKQRQQELPTSTTSDDQNEEINNLDLDDDRIEVKILPQDNWGETATAYTSEVGSDINGLDNDLMTTDCRGGNGDQMIDGHFENQSSEKSTLQCTKKWLSKLRRRSECFPRIHLYKTLMLVWLLLILCAYWTYYVWKLLLYSINNLNYDQILQYTSSYIDILLFLHYITLLIFEIKYLYPKYVVRIVRSPDGIARQYSIGSMSLQEAGIYLLELYYRDFPQYNPWLENAQQRTRRNGGFRNYSTKSMNSQSTNLNFKIYNVDQTQTTIPTTIISHSRPYNERFYDELEYERRVRKRRTKLLVACEDAFTHVKKCHDERGSHIPMDSREAAQAVFSSMSHSLQKYLRITRQQPYYTRESIIYHLSRCLSYDISPRAFLERYLIQTEQTSMTISSQQEQQPQNQQWLIICDKQLNRSIHANLLLILKYEDIQLMCTFNQLPKIQLKQDYFDHKQNKFILKLNSETSV
ncbi:unnamed protein product [Didymodactylos carnosus]|uniref:Vang-like protein n=1 Tax=Didymodactylos carnosus TaxID=1234261 RepID=A0A814YA57_9BILA|nr:unnamed protein product [Didymodactylos carnosus]CAF3990424.1 unnamed protein product [Didymodactylos carnosus]